MSGVLERGRSYAAFAGRITATGIISDPWVEGVPRFRSEPLLLSRAEWSELGRVAEEVAAVHDALSRIVVREPELLRSFFGLTAFQRLMALSSAPHWHGIARADLFRTSDGIACCELNSDTPSGEAEAVLLSELAAADLAAADLEEGGSHLDPNHGLVASFCEMVEASARGIGIDRPASAGIVYPTEIPEDLSMVTLYRRALEARGWRVTLGSPYNLSSDARGRVLLLGEPCDVVVRHYKTDWWGERRPAWDDDACPDEEPLRDPLRVLLTATVERRCAVVNPFGAVLTQNKRAMAFMWEEIQRFPAAARRTIRAHVPFSARLEAMPREDLAAARHHWVLKSDYGCEGNEVVLGSDCTDEEWESALDHAVPGRWIAQQRFEPLADGAGEAVNHGVYVVAGNAAGILCRAQKGPTDRHARTVGALVEHGVRMGSP